MTHILSHDFYQAVRAALVAKGTSFGEVCSDLNIPACSGKHYLHGCTNGPDSVEFRQIISEISGVKYLEIRSLPKVKHIVLPPQYTH